MMGFTPVKPVRDDSETPSEVVNRLPVASENGDGKKDKHKSK
jgi:hypothetical protein